MKVEHTMTPKQLAEWEQKVKDRTLFGGDDWRSPVYDAAAERWPDRVVPYGGQSALARDLGLNTVTVHSALVQAGYQFAPQPPADPPHGTAYRYRKYGCRCNECGFAESERGRAYRASKKQEGAPADTARS